MPTIRPTTMPPPDVLTASEVAARLNLPVRRIYALIKSGDLPRVMVGRRAVRVPRAAFEQWLSAQDAAPKSETGAELFARLGAGEIGRQILARLDGLEERQSAAQAGFLAFFENAAPRR